VRKSRRLVLGAALALGALVALAAVAYLWQVRPLLYRGRQIRSCADMITVAIFLKEHRGSTGAYPQHLEDAIPKKHLPGFLNDGFGTPFLYETRDDGFILVSLGADRQPDGLDYWGLRDASAPAERVAGQLSADQVLSDQGWHREAGN
jgi:hypothetical protein